MPIPKVSDPIAGQWPVSVSWRAYLESLDSRLTALASVAAPEVTFPDPPRLNPGAGISVYGNIGYGQIATVSLSLLPDSGVGAGLVKITRDDYGRVAGTQAATTTDLPEGANLYYTDERAQDAIGLALAAGTQDGVTVAYDDAGNAINVTNTDKGSVARSAHEAAADPHPQYTTAAEAQAIADAKVQDIITDGVTDKAPSQNAVFDALAGKAPLASPQLTGEVTVNSTPVGPPVAMAIAASGDTRADFYGTGKSTLDADNATQFVFWGRALAALPLSAEKRIGAFSFSLKGATAGHRGGVFKIALKRDNSTVISDTLVVDGVSIAPGADNAFTGGSAALRYSELFAVNSVINTSDAREKTAPRDLTSAELAAALDIARLPCIFQWLHAIEAKGEGARLHASPTVQSVIAVMRARGLDPFRYGLVCYDQWDETPELRDEGTGEVVQERSPAGDRYSLRQGELAAFIMRALVKRQDDIEARLAALGG